MYTLIIAILCITHLSITASEQEQPQIPTSPRAEDTPRPETPSDDHVVRVHNRRQSSLKSLAALSLTSATQTRSSVSSLGEPASPKSSVELSPTASLVVRTESPKQATPIRVSPKSAQGPNQGRIALHVEDETSISGGFCILCSCICMGVLGGVVLSIIAAAKQGNPFN